LSASPRPTLLFLPGTLCDERLWKAQQQALSAQWSCDVVDYQFADSISAMATKALAQNTGLVIPIGLSMGGMVALEIWRQAPERVAAMALFDTDCGADTLDRRKNRDAQILLAVHGEFHQMVETQLVPAYFSIEDVNGDAANQAARKTAIAMALDMGIATFAAQITALATRTDSWPLLDTIRAPTLIAYGKNDRICSPESHRKVAALIDHAAFIEINDAGHMPPLEQSDATTRVLQKWLGSLALP
jgi:pimeloyl-ACP methyl ester carboxylesterase